MYAHFGQDDVDMCATNMLAAMHVHTWQMTVIMLRAFIRVRRSVRTQIYMTRAAIPLPIDCHATGALLNSNDDRSCIDITSFTRQAFYAIHRHFDQFYGAAATTGRPRSLDSVSALMLTLQYINTTVPVKALHMLYGTAPATTYNVLQRSLNALQRALDVMSAARIAWPTPNR